MESEMVSRMSPRDEILGYRLGTELSAVASFAGTGDSTGRLVQVSLEHLRMHLASGATVRPGQTASVVLGLGERWTTALEAEVTDVHFSGPGSEMGLRLVAPPLDAGRRIVSVLEALRDDGKLLTPEARPVWKEPIRQADRILRIWDALVSRRCRGVARDRNGRRVEVRAVHLDRYGKEVGWELSGPLPQAPFSLEAFGYSSVLTFEATQVREAGGLMLVPLPEQMVRFRHRWLRRAPVSTDCTLHFTHPLWSQVRVQRSLLDISYEGISCYTEPGEDLLYPGMRLPLLQVQMPGREPVALRAEVRNISSTSRGRRCGMWVTPVSDSQERPWRDLVEEQMHPDTRVAGEWNEASWELFERSGYFHLSGKEPAKFEALKAQWYDTQERLEKHRELGYRVVRPMERGSRQVEASFSVIKPYSGSWLGHQLARQKPPTEKGIPPRSARHALRDTYLRSYEPAQLDPEVKWFLCYYEAHVRWTRFTQFDFVSWYEHTGKACLVPFRLMEAEVDQPWPATAPGLQVDTPTEAERELLLGVLEKTRPVAYREGLDLVRERLDLEGLKQDWARAQLTRERELRVVRHQGRPLAMAVLESAHQGLNLFNILDGVRLFGLVEDDSGDEVQDAYLALLVEAARWYRARERRVFIHYLESQNPAYAERAALADLGEGKLWIMSRALLPEYIEHLCEATTPRADS